MLRTPAEPESTQLSRRGRPVSQEKQNAVMLAAITEFASQGYESASMDDIAAKAGVSKRTLYNRFESKEGLFGSLVDELAGRIVASSTIAYRPTEPLREQLLTYASETKAFMSQSSNLRLLRAVLGEHIRHPKRVESLLHKYWVNEYGFHDWMTAAKRDGRLKGDPATMAHLFGAMMKSIIFWPTVLGRGTPSDPGLDEMCAAAVDMFLSYHASPNKGSARR